MVLISRPCDPPTLASQSARITGLCHHAQPVQTFHTTLRKLDVTEKIGSFQHFLICKIAKYSKDGLGDTEREVGKKAHVVPIPRAGLSCKSFCLHFKLSTCQTKQFPIGLAFSTVIHLVSPCKPIFALLPRKMKMSDVEQAQSLLSVDRRCCHLRIDPEVQQSHHRDLQCCLTYNLSAVLPISLKGKAQF
ncbi:hypothetical protein AAY473_009924 [Plecturocebus cupreus]